MAHTRSIKKVGRNDFEVLVDGEIVGYTGTMIEAIEAADQHIAGLLELEARYITEEAADQAAPVASEAPAAPVAVNVANISRQSVAAVLVEARRKVADNRRWATALAKAATELEASGWYFTGQILVIASRTTPGTRYRVTAQGCECPAHSKGNPCWHKAARKLLINAAQRPAQAA